MFSEEYYQEIRTGFESRMALLKRQNVNLEKMEAVFRQCSREEAQALTFLYGAMPISDLLDYPAELFWGYARHGVFLWKQGPFAGRVPEKLFANYVLCCRVNNEDLEDVRSFFYEKLMDCGRLKDFCRQETCGDGKSNMYEAVKEVNYWCAGEASYSATDDRTQNPRTVLKAAIGRCGEESVFTVTALRSIGIPARQVYVPLWSHCDDNHAWVEAWCDGEWHFLGACEPEERLDRGWFTGAASRAMLVHSRWFGADSLQKEDITAGQNGMARMLNHLQSYARTRALLVRTVDETGAPVPGARLEFQILNQGRLRPIAALRTGTGAGDCGTAGFLTGCGDLWVSAFAGGLYGEMLVSLTGRQADAKECVLVLKQEPECREEWEELDFHAPDGGAVPEEALTREERFRQAHRLKETKKHRTQKQDCFLDEKELHRFLEGFAREDRQALEAILRKSRGNAGELMEFLSREPQECGVWKRKLLETLREKDLWDIRREVLTDCWENARVYEGSLPEDIFFHYVVCPRVENEMLRPCRRWLLEKVETWRQEQIRRDPGLVWELAESRICSFPEQEYEGLITSPAACLQGGIGSRISKKIFCVTLCRSLGIPARLNPLDGWPQYWREGRWICAGEACENGEKEQIGKEGQVSGKPDGGRRREARLIFRWGRGLSYGDTDFYSLDRFEGGSFRHLNPEGCWKEQETEENETALTLRPGIYRIITTVRKKNGDQLARMLTFRLGEGQRKEVELSLRETSPEDLLIHERAEETAFRTLEGERVLLSELAAGTALLLWLEAGREPTEHILNELYELRERFRALTRPLYMVVKNAEDLQSSTLLRTRKALPDIRILLEESEEKAGRLAESVGQKAGRLPLALVLREGRECVYSAAGYRTGQGELLWRVLSLSAEGTGQD